MMIRSDANIFLNNATKIVKQIGIHVKEIEIMGNETSGYLYEDTIILIKVSDDNQFGEIERKTTHNIFYMKIDGNIIRFDSDFIFLDEHINELLKGLNET